MLDIFHFFVNDTKSSSSKKDEAKKIIYIWKDTNFSKCFVDSEKGKRFIEKTFEFSFLFWNLYEQQYKWERQDIRNTYSRLNTNRSESSKEWQKNNYLFPLLYTDNTEPDQDQVMYTEQMVSLFKVYLECCADHEDPKLQENLSLSPRNNTIITEDKSSDSFPLRCIRPFGSYRLYDFTEETEDEQRKMTYTFQNTSEDADLVLFSGPAKHNQNINLFLIWETIVDLIPWNSFVEAATKDNFLMLMWTLSSAGQAEETIRFYKPLKEEEKARVVEMDIEDDRPTPETMSNLKRHDQSCMRPCVSYPYVMKRISHLKKVNYIAKDETILEILNTECKERNHSFYQPEEGRLYQDKLFFDMEDGPFPLRDKLFLLCANVYSHYVEMLFSHHRFPVWNSETSNDFEDQTYQEYSVLYLENKKKADMLLLEDVVFEDHNQKQLEERYNSDKYNPEILVKDVPDLELETDSVLNENYVLYLLHEIESEAFFWKPYLPWIARLWQENLDESHKVYLDDMTETFFGLGDGNIPWYSEQAYMAWKLYRAFMLCKNRHLDFSVCEDYPYAMPVSYQEDTIRNADKKIFLHVRYIDEEDFSRYLQVLFHPETELDYIVGQYDPIFKSFFYFDPLHPEHDFMEEAKKRWNLCKSGDPISVPEKIPIGSFVQDPNLSINIPMIWERIKRHFRFPLEDEVKAWMNEMQPDDWEILTQMYASMVEFGSSRKHKRYVLYDSKKHCFEKKDYAESVQWTASEFIQEAQYFGWQHAPYVPCVPGAAAELCRHLLPSKAMEREDHYRRHGYCSLHGLKPAYFDTYLLFKVDGVPPFPSNRYIYRCMLQFYLDFNSLT